MRALVVALLLALAFAGGVAWWQTAEVASLRARCG
jgi:hypothetical protein